MREIGPSHPLTPWTLSTLHSSGRGTYPEPDGRTSTESLRGTGVQRFAYELGAKVLSSLLALARRGDCGESFDSGIYLESGHSTARRVLEHPQE